MPPPPPGQRCDYHRCIALNSIFMSLSSQSVLHRAKKIQKRFHLFFTHRKLRGIWPHAPATSVTRAAVSCWRRAAACGWGPKRQVWQLQIHHPAPHPGHFFTRPEGGVPCSFCWCAPSEAEGPPPAVLLSALFAEAEVVTLNAH